MDDSSPAGPVPDPDDAQLLRSVRRLVDRLGSRLGAPLPVRPFTFRQDVVYSPDFVAPPLWRARRIVTIHDLAFEVAALGVDGDVNDAEDDGDLHSPSTAPSRRTSVAKRVSGSIVSW